MVLMTTVLLSGLLGDGDAADPPGGSREGLLLKEPERILDSVLGETPGAPEPAPQVEPDPWGPDEPRPLRPDTGRPVRPGRGDTWLYFALGPMRGGRNSLWHGLFNTPPLEEALALPVGAYHVRMGLDLVTADWASSEEGGSSRWKAASITETFEYNYAPVRGVLLGLRLCAGELRQGDHDRVRVFEDGAQLVPDGERGFGAESVVFRAKYVLSLGFMDMGAVGELKLPLADEEDLLTADTTDLGVSWIATKRWGSFALHLNAGMVFPFGNPSVLRGVDEADPFPHAGLAAAWMPLGGFSVFAQVEFNGSAFGDVTVWDEPAVSVQAGGRIRLSPTLFLSGAAGRGLDEDSGDFLASGGIDMTF